MTTQLPAGKGEVQVQASRCTQHGLHPVIQELIPPLHISRIGPFLQILAIRENTGETLEGIGNDTGRSGEKRGEMGRNGEIG